MCGRDKSCVGGVDSRVGVRNRVWAAWTRVWACEIVCGRSGLVCGRVKSCVGGLTGLRR